MYFRNISKHCLPHNWEVSVSRPVPRSKALASQLAKFVTFKANPQFKWLDCTAIMLYYPSHISLFDVIFENQFPIKVNSKVFCVILKLSNEISVKFFNIQGKAKIAVQ